MAPTSVLDDLVTVQSSLFGIKLAYPMVKTFLGGNFNLSGISWSDGTLTGPMTWKSEF